MTELPGGLAQVEVVPRPGCYIPRRFRDQWRLACRSHGAAEVVASADRLAATVPADTAPSSPLSILADLGGELDLAERPGPPSVNNGPVAASEGVQPVTWAHGNTARP